MASISSEIAFIHDAKGPAERSQMFEAVREGRIRVLIGSTEKMGTGMNVQTRALAMHHLDAPAAAGGPGAREGRIIRQGNLYPEVFSFVYIVESSFDGYSWQILETKAKFIEQFLTGQTDVREMEDIGEASALHGRDQGAGQRQPEDHWSASWSRTRS